jgi:phage terminase small subunit
MTNVLSSEERQVRDSEFVDEFINNGGNATQAAKTVGVSDGSANTVGYRLKNRLVDEIEVEQKEALKGYATKALHQVQTLAETAVSENVKLNANRDLLDRVGWKPIDRSEVTEVTDLQNMTTEELQAELDSLYKADGKSTWMYEY